MDNVNIKRYIFKGIETDYYVSTKGEVFSNKKNDMKKMSLTRSGHGYRKVRLCINGKIYNRNVHRMIAETFIQNPENKEVVNHIDGNKENNNVENLEWATSKENSVHAYNTGLMGKGETFATSKLTNEQCTKICELLQDTNLSRKEISDTVGCTSIVVFEILRKKTWRHISDNYDFSHRRKSKLITIDDAIKICELLSNTTLSSKEIAEKVGCSPHHVKDIKRHKTWKSVSEKYNL